jgi:hypothetical protein
MISAADKKNLNKSSSQKSLELRLNKISEGSLSSSDSSFYKGKSAPKEEEKKVPYKVPFTGRLTLRANLPKDKDGSDNDDVGT